MSALAPSKLQLEGMGGDVDLESFNLQMRNKAGIKLVSAITSADIERTIEGASTLTVIVDDDNESTILKSNRLGRNVDVNLDGLWFRLVGVKKAGRRITLVFEEREVNLLRQHNSWIKADRATTTRAQFAKRLIVEAGLRYMIPELDYVPPVSDVGPGQVLVGAAGQTTVVPQLDDPAQRTGGIPDVVDLTVKGDPATREQVANANTIIATGLSMKVSTKVLVAAIMTAITESSITNLTGGDRDSVGIFQQRASQGWPASRDIPTDAAAFFRRAAAIDAAQPNISYEMLCQSVQHSAFSDGSNYKPWKDEAEKFVKEYGVATDQQATADNNQGYPQSQGSGAQFFMRGRIEQRGTSWVLTKENSWDCLQRLAQEVNWRCFVVSGLVYFISEFWLFKSKPFMTLTERSDGIDEIDFDYDEGKRTATVSIDCHLSRWSAPMGSIVRLKEMGIVNGRWLVNDVNRSIYDTKGTITLKKPLPRLPEPTTLSAVPTGAPEPVSPAGAKVTAPNDIAAKVLAYAYSQLGVPYQWGAESKGVAFDCSGLTEAAYAYAGVNIPRVAQQQYGFGPVVSVVQDLVPGDLVFFGTSSNIHHVGIYIGNGDMIDAPHTGAVVRIDKDFKSTWPDYYGATRPWQQ